MRLAEGALLETRWEPAEQSGRPPRHLYRLTQDGATLARARLARRAEMTPASSKAPTVRLQPRTAS